MLPIRLMVKTCVMCAFPGLEKLLQKPWVVFVSALLVLDILCSYCEKRLVLPLLNPVLQAAVPFCTFSKSSGLPCIPKQKNLIASQLDNSTQTISL